MPPAGLFPGQGAQSGVGFLAPVLGQTVTTRTAATLAASETIAKDALAMAINGVAYTARSGTALAGVLAALSSQMAGADANGNVVLCSHGRAKVRVQFLAGNSKTLSLDSIVYGASYIDVKVQLGTDSGGTVTTTAAVCALFINSHALLQRIGLRAVFSGTGASLCALQGLTDIALVGLLGWAKDAYANGTGSNASLEMTFGIGGGIMSVAAGLDRTTVPAAARAVNGTTVSTVFASELDLPIQALDVNAAGKALVLVE